MCALLPRCHFLQFAIIYSDGSNSSALETSKPTRIATSSYYCIMPKEKRAKALVGQSTRHAPLGQVIRDDEDRAKYATAKARRAMRDADDSDDEHELMDEKTSRRILNLSRDQQLEVEGENRAKAYGGGQGRPSSISDGRPRGVRSARATDSSDEDEEEESVLMNGGDDSE